MAVPGFTTITGPVATSLADGVTGYNGIATTADANFTKFNMWINSAALAKPVLTELKDGSVFTFSSGWELCPGYGPCIGRKWGGLTCVTLYTRRSGATLSAGTGGNLTDTQIGTLAAGYRPLTMTGYYSAVDAAGCWQVYADVNGIVKVYAASDFVELRSGSLLMWVMLFPNADIKAF